MLYHPDLLRPLFHRAGVHFDIELDTHSFCRSNNLMEVADMGEDVRATAVSIHKSVASIFEPFSNCAQCRHVKIFQMLTVKLVFGRRLAKPEEVVQIFIASEFVSQRYRLVVFTQNRLNPFRIDIDAALMRFKHQAEETCGA